MGWSASMSAAAAFESKSASTLEKTGSYSTQVKTTEVIQKSSQFSLAESDFELTHEFDHSLRCLLGVLKDNGDVQDEDDVQEKNKDNYYDEDNYDEEKKKLIANETARIFEEFGTH